MQSPKTQTVGFGMLQKNGTWKTWTEERPKLSERKRAGFIGILPKLVMMAHMMNCPKEVIQNLDRATNPQ